MNKIRSKLQIIIFSYFIFNSMFFIISKLLLNNFSLLENSLIIFIGTLLGSIIIYLYLFILKIYKFSFNKILYYIYKIILIILSLFIFKYVIGFINININNFNFYIIGIPLLILILLSAKNDLNTLLRTSEITFYIYIVFFIIFIFGNHINLNSISFTFDIRTYTLIENIVIYSVLSSIPIILISNNIDNDNFPSISIGYFLSNLIIYIYIFFIINIYGNYPIKYSSYPEVDILKEIDLFNILDKVDQIISFNYIVPIFFLLVLLVKSIKKTK